MKWGSDPTAQYTGGSMRNSDCNLVAPVQTPQGYVVIETGRHSSRAAHFRYILPIGGLWKRRGKFCSLSSVVPVHIIPQTWFLEVRWCCRQNHGNYDDRFPSILLLIPFVPFAESFERGWRQWRNRSEIRRPCLQGAGRAGLLVLAFELTKF